MRTAVMILVLALVAGAASGCRPESTESEAYGPGKETLMKLTSPAFEDGEMIPAAHTCDGADASPPLEISDVPPEAKSLALVMDDPDAPMGTFDHWVVWNIPPGVASIPEGQEPVGVAGRNSFGKTGYGGPCPPSGTHTYRFKLYALDAMLDLRPGSDKRALESAMKGHVLTEALLRGKYSRR